MHSEPFVFAPLLVGLDDIALLSVIFASASAFGSMVTALITFLKSKRSKKIDVKLSDGTTVSFDETMSDNELKQKLEDIEKQIQSLRPNLRGGPDKPS
jgi:hypothetical protein